MLFHLRLLVAAVSLLAILTGCATLRVDADAIAKMKRVGAISLTAHDFQRRHTGLTVFGNEFEKQDISTWKVDDEYDLQIQGALEKLGLFQVVHVSHDRSQFYPVYDLNGPWDAPAFRTPKWSAVEEKLRDFARVNSLDAIVLVIKGEIGDFFTGALGQVMRGAGFYSRGMGDSTGFSILHLVATVVVIDGPTGKPLATRFLTRVQKSWRADLKTMPMVDVTSDLSRLKFNELTAANIADVRSKLIELPKDTWEPTFRAMLMSEIK